MTAEKKRQRYLHILDWRRRNPYKVGGYTIRARERSVERYGRFQRALLETYFADTHSTRAELAKELGVSRSTVSLWVSGTNHLPNKYTVGPTRFGSWCRKHADRIREEVSARD